jgi:3-oxoadipate enol-lactonase
MPHADVAGRRVHYERRGEGPPLLMIQGLSGNHLHWGEPFLSQLDGDFETIVFDNRGVGHSDPAPDPYSIADLADDAAGLLDALGFESAHVLGISMGGMIAQELALRHPEKVRTLTLGCTYSGGPRSRLTDETVVQALAAAVMSGDPVQAQRVAFEYNASPEFRADPANIEPLREIAAQLPPAGLEVLMAQAQAVGGFDASPRLGEISAPTLIIHGTEDQMLPVSNVDVMAETIPDVRHVEILDGVGHMFWWERPERSAQLVRELAQGAPAPQ